MEWIKICLSDTSELVTRTWRLGIARKKLKSILLREKMIDCWWTLFFLNMSNTAVVTWCAYLVLITFTAFSKHIPAANEFTVPASLSDSGHPDPNMRSPRVLNKAISIWSPPRSATNWSFFLEIQGRSTDSSFSDRKEADTVITGICVGLKSTVIFSINSIQCRLWCCSFLMKETEPRAILSGRKWWFNHCYGKRLSYDRLLNGDIEHFSFITFFFWI